MKALMGYVSKLSSSTTTVSFLRTDLVVDIHSMCDLHITDALLGYSIWTSGDLVSDCIMVDPPTLYRFLDVLFKKDFTGTNDEVVINIQAAWDVLSGNDTKLRVFTSNTMPAVNPTGASCVVVAQDKDHAVKLLQEELRERGDISPTNINTVNTDDFHEVDIEAPYCLILQDGEY